MIDHDERIEKILVGDLIKWLEERYKKDKYRNAFDWTRRIGIIQTCDLYLSDLTTTKRSLNARNKT